MRNKIFPIFFIAALVLISPLAFSLKSFEIGAIGGERRLCPTHTESISIPIENKGDETISFTISLSGTAQKWAVVAPTGFSLDPGKIKTVYIWVTPSSKTLPGIYDLNINVDGGAAGKKELNYNIIVETCHNVEIKVDDKSKKSCPGETTVYELTVRNTGEYTEDFVFSISGTAKDWATLSKQSTKLNKNEEDIVMLYVKAPADKSGKYILTTTVNSKDSDAMDIEDIEILLESCYDYSLITDKDSYSFCDHTHAKIPLLVENDGIVDNTYTLKLSGPNWAKLENNEVFIAKGEAKKVNLTIFPDYYETGDYVVILSAQSKTGEVLKEKEIKLLITPCFITDLQISKQEDTICAESSKTYEISLTNAGKFKQPYRIYIEGPEWASLDKNFIELEAGENEKINLIIDAPRVIGLQEIKVVAKSQEPSGTTDEDILKLEVLSKEVCFEIALFVELNKLDVARGEGALIPILLENKGKETATYSLEVSGAGTSFAQLNPSTITIDSGKTETAYLYVAIPEEAERDEYTLSVSARLDKGTVQASDNIHINVVESGLGIDIKDVETEEETEEENEVKEEKTGILNSIKSTISGAASSAGNKITGAFTGVSGFGVIKDNWKYIIGAIIVILILILLWQGTKGESKEEKEVKEEPEEEKEVKEEKKKNNKKKKKIVNKIKELLEEDEE